MVTRVNGSVDQGVFFSKDVKFMTVSNTNATFLADLIDYTAVDTGAAPTALKQQYTAAVGSDLELVCELVAQRATIIGVHVGGAAGTTTTDVEFILDYAGAYPVDAAAVAGTATLVEVLAGEINTAITGVTTITVAEGFFPATPGAPA